MDLILTIYKEFVGTTHESLRQGIAKAVSTQPDKIIIHDVATPSVREGGVAIAQWSDRVVDAGKLKKAHNLIRKANPGITILCKDLDIFLAS